MIKLLAAALLVVTTGAALAQAAPETRPTVLITAGSESDTSAMATAAGTKVGGVAVGSSGATSSTYEHSEVWEVFRRFSTECPAAIFVTNPDTPHTLTIHTDYQKIANPMLGTLIFYQLSLLDAAGNPLYVSKKDYLRHEIKPICKVIKPR